MRRLIVVSILALSACASSPRDPASSTQVQTVRVMGSAGEVVHLPVTVTNRAHLFTLPYSAEQLWRVLPGVYESLGIEVTQLNTATRTIGNPSFTARRRLGGVVLSRYFDCGRTQDVPSAETYELQPSVLTQLAEGEAGTTTVSVSVRATGRPLNYPSGSIQCSSTGGLELRIIERLQAQVQG